MTSPDKQEQLKRDVQKWRDFVCKCKQEWIDFQNYMDIAGDYVNEIILKNNFQVNEIIFQIIKQICNWCQNNFKVNTAINFGCKKIGYYNFFAHIMFQFDCQMIHCQHIWMDLEADLKHMQCMIYSWNKLGL